MSILFPVLLAAATMNGAGPKPAEFSTDVAVVSMPRTTLSIAVAAAAPRVRLTLDRGSSVASQLSGRRSARQTGRVSSATRVTAIFAGAVMGSLAGLLVGGAIDAATSNGECLTGMAYGFPIGAAVGGGLTAYWIR